MKIKTEWKLKRAADYACVHMLIVCPDLCRIVVVFNIQYKSWLFPWFAEFFFFLIIILKYNVTLPIICLQMGLSAFWQHPVSCFSGADVSIVQLLCLCSFSSAHWEGMTLLSQPSHWQAHLVWHYGALWSEATALFQVTRTADYKARTQLPRVAFVLL